MYVGLCMSEAGDYDIQKKESEPLELQLKAVVCWPTWLRGNKFRSSARKCMLLLSRHPFLTSINDLLWLEIRRNSPWLITTSAWDTQNSSMLSPQTFMPTFIGVHTSDRSWSINLLTKIFEILASLNKCCCSHAGRPCHDHAY